MMIPTVRTPEEMVEAIRALLSLPPQSDIIEPVRKLLQAKTAFIAALRLLKEHL